jgi:CubicO group peptidase (beta-lactamase class C family)
MRRKKAMPLYLALFALILAFVVPSRMEAADSFTPRVEEVLAELGINSNTPGIGILAVDKGQIVFEKGYGLANLSQKTPITPETNFELASCSKQFTGAAILRLYEQGKLKLEDDVRKYLPELPVYDEKNPITILDLARHTSGLPEYFDLPTTNAEGRSFTKEELLKEFGRQTEKTGLNFATGEKYEYINSNYVFLAFIVERVSQQSFGAFLQEAFFDPLGMDTTSVFDSKTFAPDKPALGYGRNESGGYEILWGPPAFYKPTSIVVGDGGVWSNLADLAQWDKGWREGKVLKPETIKYALVPSKTRSGAVNDYAFGWTVEMENGKLKTMEHDGSWGGFHNLILRNVAEDYTLVILSNNDDVAPYTVAEKLLK